MLERILITCLIAICYFVFSNLIVQTENGLIEGFVGKTGIRIFLGVPYAAPPVGALRWHNPEPHSNWSGVKKTQKHGPPCPQVLLKVFTNEDCLHLNIYAPSNGTNEKLPVLVWFFGGGFLIGDGFEYGLYDGEKFSHSQNVIIVTFNYRVGVFGSFSYKNLSGNFGFKDQQFVLQWIQRNIENFGGDANNVTLMGESAGALSIAAHLANSLSSPLFHRGILMSCPFGLNTKTREKAEEYGRLLARKLFCSSEKCLLNAASWRLLSSQPVVPNLEEKMIGDVLIYSYFIDGIDVVDNPFELLRKGLYSKKPLIIGTNRDETSFFTSLMDPLRFLFEVPPVVFTYPVYKAHLENVFKDKANQVIDQYPLSWNFNTNYESFLRLTCSMIFTCPSALIAGISSENSNTYYYELNMVPDYLPVGECSGKVCHAVDLAYVFGNIPLFFTQSKPSFDINAENYIDFLNEKFGDYQSSIMECFPVINDGNNFENLAKIDHFSSLCGSENLIDSFGLNEEEECSVDKVCFILRAQNYSGSLRNGSFKKKISFTEREKRIILFFQSKFSSFARGDINNNSLIKWLPFDSVHQRYISLEEVSQEKQQIRPDECPLWNKIGFNF